MMILFLFPFSFSFSDTLPFEESNKTATPMPTPQKEIVVPLREIICIREYIVLFLLLLYIVVYFAGVHSVTKRKDQISSTFKSIMRKFFLIVPDSFYKSKKNVLHTYITGRTYYTGAIVKVEFPKCFDIFTIIWNKIFGKKTTITFELLCEPLMKNTAIFSYRNKLLKQYAEYSLDEEKMEDSCNFVFTDFGSSKSIFINLIKEYEKKYPKSILSIDLNDMNRFETAEAGRFVARIKLNISKIDDINEEMFDFVMKIGDEFNMLQLDQDAYSHNIHVRESLATKGIDPKLLKKK